MFKKYINKYLGLFFLVLTYVLFFTTPPGVYAAALGIVQGDYVNIRGGPGTNYAVVGAVSEGDSLTVLEESNNWYKVSYAGGLGWISGQFVLVAGETDRNEDTVSQPTQTGIIKSGPVNVRSGPGTEHNIIGQANTGERLPILEKSGDWYKVKLSGGEGWVAGWLVQLEQGHQTSQNPFLPQNLGQPESNNNGTGSNADQVKTGSSTPQKSVPTMPEWLRPREDTNPPQPDPKPEDPEEPEDWNGPTLSELDVKEKNDEVTITIKATGKFEVNTFTLDNPERLVLDLNGIAPGDVPEAVKVSSDIVKQVRTGWFSNDPVTSRIVVDLKKRLRYTTSLSRDKRTLTVKLFVPKPGEELVNRLIVVDAGHGGSDPGAIGPSGIYEKVLTLDIAKKLADLLEEQGARVVLARSDDSYVGLYERTDLANELRADLFVSVHINASTSSSLSGTTTYYYGEQGKELCEFIQPELVSALGRNNLGVRYANFAVLRTSEMPAALVEVAFISNPEEERLLKTEEFRRKAAEAIARGISNYYLYK
ncbi:N-acetylmuramoyl-L-alanine amidase [Desulfolucanica intricata]|uniref:N-acetylmuramoyl-L-alanine amidase n=1 Tax=Desulfolucanica intricata TaxID=1285191 RepID=UPI000836FC7E|nr:N-acetylmuramoyl-L-alanine amidase [Desulfolucanica intricata]